MFFLIGMGRPEGRRYGQLCHSIASVTSVFAYCCFTPPSLSFSEFSLSVPSPYGRAGSGACSRRGGGGVVSFHRGRLLLPTLYCTGGGGRTDGIGIRILKCYFLSKILRISQQNFSWILIMGSICELCQKFGLKHSFYAKLAFLLLVHSIA